MQTISSVPFETARREVEQAYRALTSSRRDEVDMFVLNHGTAFIENIPEAHFISLVGMGNRDELLGHIHPSVVEWVGRFEPGQRSVPCAGPVLAVMLALWIDQRSGNSSDSRWRTPFSNAIGSAVSRRLRNIEHARMVAEFYRGVGSPAQAPLPDDPRTRSPTSRLEHGAELPAETKVNVLRNLIDARNHRGITTPDGIFRTGHLVYNKWSLEAARRFFEANPRLSVAGFEMFLYACHQALETPISPPTEDDDDKMLRECRNLGYLLSALPRVAKGRGPEDAIEVFLGKRALFGPQAKAVEGDEALPEGAKG